MMNKLFIYNHVKLSAFTNIQKHRQSEASTDKDSFVPASHFTFIQPKLSIGAVDDPLEDEADAMADKVMCMPENNFKEMSQRACDHVIQRDNEEGKPDEPETKKKSGLQQQSTAPDFLKLKTPFFERNVPHLWHPASALGVWRYNYNFFKIAGLPDNLAGKAANLTAPFAIDAQLKSNNPTWWEITDKDLKTTSVMGRIPAFSFDADFKNWKLLPFLQKKCEDCEQKEHLQLKSLSTSTIPYLQAKNENMADASPEVSQTIESSKGHGKSLDGNTRSFMESRFGADFSKVKIHTDYNAVNMNRELHAKAFTVGRDIYFNEGRYSPDSQNGKQLLAHELTHVIQQQGLIQRKPSRKNVVAKVFYQELINERIKINKGLVHFASGPVDMLGELPPINALIDVAEAIDKKNKTEIPALLAELNKQNVNKYFSYPSKEVLFDMIIRLLEMGLANESVDLRQWYDKTQQKFQVKGFSSSTSIFTLERVAEMLEQRKAANADEAIALLDLLFMIFKQVNDEMAGAKGNDYLQLQSIVTNLFPPIQLLYQMVLDKALDGLAAKTRNTKYFLIAKDIVEKKLSGLIIPAATDPKAKEKDHRYLAVTTTTTKFEKAHGKHTDAFAGIPSGKGRSVVIDYYDKDFLPEMGHDLLSNFGTILLTRQKQIVAIEKIYGLQKDASNQLTPESKDNTKALDQLGDHGLRLENEDDWRQFVLLKFTEAFRRSGNKEEAFDSVLNILQTYLQAFTIHTPYNINDYVENPFGKKFPRALSGQLIHDCGVYGLRIAYILSLVRNHPDLRLRIRMITLPVHVGLIITGDNFPAYIIHNDTFSKYSTAALADYKKNWVKTNEKGEDAATPVAFNEDKFFAELAGNEFIPGVDLPYKLFDVPNATASASGYKKTLWEDFYKKKIVKTELFSKEANDATKPFYQIHLDYLKILDMIVDHHNDKLLPYWNVKARTSWFNNKKKLEDAIDTVKKTKDPVEKTKAEKILKDLVDKYADELWKEISLVTEAFEPVKDAQAALNKKLEDNPQAITKGIDRTSGRRMAALINQVWWEEEFNNHLINLLNLRTDNAPYEQLRMPILR